MILIIYFIALGYPISLIWAASIGSLGVEPTEELQKLLGQGAFWMLLMSMSIRPAMQFARLRQILVYRRVFGLIAFFYAFLHMFLYQWGQDFNFDSFLDDLLKRYHLRYGIFCFGILVLLAITSNLKSQKILGKKWKKLHQTVYVAICLAGLHLYLAHKVPILSDKIYVILICLCLCLRLKFLNRFLVRILSSTANKK